MRNILTLIILTMIILTLTGCAGTQRTTLPPVQVSASPDSKPVQNFYPVESWRELLELIIASNRYFFLESQKNYVPTCKKAAESLVGPAYKNKFNILFDSVEFLMEAHGNKVSSSIRSPVNTNRSGCSSQSRSVANSKKRCPGQPRKWVSEKCATLIARWLSPSCDWRPAKRRRFRVTSRR